MSTIRQRFGANKKMITNYICPWALERQTIIVSIYVSERCADASAMCLGLCGVLDTSAVQLPSPRLSSGETRLGLAIFRGRPRSFVSPLGLYYFAVGLALVCLSLCLSEERSPQYSKLPTSQVNK